MKKKKLINESRRLVELWRPRLSLWEWQIDLELGGLLDDALAQVHVQRELHTASIILDHKKRPGIKPERLEEIIVHELTHIYFAMCLPGKFKHKLQEVILEQQVNKITLGFLKAYNEQNQT